MTNSNIVLIKMLWLLVASFVILGVESAPGLYNVTLAKSTSRIVGGKDALIQTYPYQVSLQKNGKHNCGGSIISANWILTAAHCVPKVAQVNSVRAGTSVRDEGGSVHTVDKVIRNEDSKLSGKLVGDVALLHLVEPIKFDETRRPISLFSATDKVKEDQSGVITGWGRTVQGSPQFSRQLQTVTVPVVNTKTCNKAYKGKVTAGMICAGYYDKGGKDACQGDSGGPMVIDGKLAGVTSWGNGCALAKFPGVYVEIAYYRDWIKLQSGI